MEQSEKNSAIHYRVEATPTTHLFTVTLTLMHPEREGQRFWLPAWIPGSYKIRDFAKHIVRLRASHKGQDIACHKIDKSTWQCAPVPGSIIVTYDVYAWDLSVRGAHLDNTHGFFNGTSLFLCAQGFENSACQLEVMRPSGASYQSWGSYQCTRGCANG